jgi:hypothetical protein
MSEADELGVCTIIADRYGGVYSRGRWTAWNMYPEQIPSDPSGDDITAADFWLRADGEDNQPLVGRGAPPTEACEDLKRRLASR